MLKYVSNKGQLIMLWLKTKHMSLQVELGMIKQEGTLSKSEFSDEIKRICLLWSTSKAKDQE